MPEAMSPDFREKMIEAIKAFKQKDYDAALIRVKEAEMIQSDTTATANLRGAISLQTGNFDDARKFFNEALTLDPTFYPAKFNLGEIPFQQKDYAASREVYRKLLEENPKDELAQYKVFLTYLLEKNDERAAEELEKIEFPSDTPAYYFAHAAWEFAHGNVAEAESWIQSSARIFPPHVNLIYAESLEELGWLNRGGTPPEK